MPTKYTPEYVEEMGKRLFMRYLQTLPVERRLEGLKPEEVLRLFKPEDRLKGLKPEDIEAYLRQITQQASDT